MSDATDSILTSTKKVLGVGEDYEVFDMDILTHINSALSTMDQLGVGPFGGMYVEDKTATWEDLGLDGTQLGMARAYIYLKVRIAFDPPSTSYLLEALAKQIQEHEWRLNSFREVAIMEVIL